jgi:hypothetical protein
MKSLLMPTQRVCLPVEEFRGRMNDLATLVEDPTASRYISSLKLAAGMFVDRTLIEEVSQFYGLEKGPKIHVMADLGLTGGYEAMAEVADSASRVFNLTLVGFIFAAGVPEDGVRESVASMKSTRFHGVDFLLTGALPENDPKVFRKEYRTGPKRYTKEKIRQARRLGFMGAYGAATYASERSRLKLGAGISRTGSPYEGSGGIWKNAVDLETALERCDELVIGKQFLVEGDILD